MEATGGVEQQDVIALQLGRIERAARDIDRLLTGDDRQGRDLDLRAERGELYLRVRAIDVERRHQHLLAVAPDKALGELGGGRGLARPLQADQHDHRRRGDVEFEYRRIGAEQLDQRVVDELDDLLPRGDRAQHVLADRQLGRLVDEVPRDGQRDVRLEQRDAYLAHRRADIGFGKRTTTAQAIEDAAKPVAQTVEHQITPFPNAPIGTNAKHAGGRNLVGRRRPWAAVSRVLSDTIALAPSAKRPIWQAGQGLRGINLVSGHWPRTNGHRLTPSIPAPAQKARFGTGVIGAKP